MAPKTAAGLKFATVVAVLTSLVGGTLWRAAANGSSTEDGCDPAGPRATHLVLVDPSDKVDSVTLSEAGAYHRKVEPGAKLELRVLADAENGRTERRFARCSPGFECNPLVENCKEREAAYHAEFASAFESEILSLAAREPARWSPLLEALERMADGELRGGVGQRVLVIFSDGLQRSPATTHYVDELPEIEHVPDLKGVHVRMHFVHRPGFSHYQGMAHLTWWRTYFERAGAASFELDE